MSETNGELPQPNPEKQEDSELSGKFRRQFAEPDLGGSGSSRLKLREHLKKIMGENSDKPQNQESQPSSESTEEPKE